MRFAILLFLCAAASAQKPAVPADPGIKTGAAIPRFSLPDQDGKPRDLASLSGPKGLMLVFFRSADW